MIHPLHNPHQLSAEQTLKKLAASEQGLSNDEAQQRLAEYGENHLPSAKKKSVVYLFCRQFINPFIYILLAAALILFGLDETSSTIFIIAVLLFNASIGTFQEYSAQRAAAVLNKMVPHFSNVVRNGKPKRIHSETLVIGDIVEIVSGDKIAADIRLISQQNLHADESLLTGESTTVEKNATICCSKDTPAAERSNMLFAGTIVTKGRCRGVVISTGINTQIGAIAGSLAQAQTKPPLLKRIENFTLNISFAVAVVIAALLLVTVIQGGDLTHMFLLAVALAVSAIPEGLPAAITITLAIGMRRMAAQNVIIRKLLAVEALGSCTLIAADKTGTLTVNELTACSVTLPDDVVFSVTGEGISGEGGIEAVDQQSPPERLDELCCCAVLNNEASLKHVNDGWQADGDMVDVAFLALGCKHHIDLNTYQSQHKRLAAIPYESENGFSATINDINGTPHLFVKGSAEKLLDYCRTLQTATGNKPLNAEHILTQNKTMAAKGYKVLALASRVLTADEHINTDNPWAHLHDLNFLGLVSMIDPLRPNAAKVVKECRESGIEVAMITGDHPNTAATIAADLGLIDTTEEAITGQQLSTAQQQGEAAFDALTKNNRVFARIEPNQKQQIVDSFIRHGHFVALTGDGVNDAPALKKAHVGVAMGKRGTDVARESADLIITDDDFTSIVAGIKQGRVVYNNIRKVVFLLISTGAAEIILFTLSVLFALPLPLTAVQLLWLNLVTNGVQDIALAFEPPDGDEIKQKPRPVTESIFNPLMLKRVALSAVVIGVLAFAVFSLALDWGFSVEEARNITLLLIVLFENVHALNSRSEHLSIIKQPFFSNPLLLFSIIIAQGVHICVMFLPGISDVLQVAPVTFELWLILLALASLLMIADTLFKRLNNHPLKNL